MGDLDDGPSIFLAGVHQYLQHTDMPSQPVQNRGLSGSQRQRSTKVILFKMYMFQELANNDTNPTSIIISTE